MSKRVYALVATLTSAVAAASIGVVTFFNPTFAEAINASITIAEGAIIGICANFIKE